MSNHVTGVIGATVGIGQYIVNDYVITLEPLEGVEGYTITITKGSEVQTATLQGVTPEQYAEMVAYLEQAQTAAQSASENASAAETAATSAAASERSAKSSKDSAASYTSSAYGYAQEAKSARAQAQTASSNASGYKNQAQTAATEAATARSAAESAATRAETAAEQVLGMTVEAETLEPGSEATVSFLKGVLSFGIPAGETGATGNGIASIVKTSTSGNIDTYTITYTSGETSTFTVTNGIDGAVLSVAGKTGAVSLDAGDVAYDESASYADGTVGARVTDLKSQIGDLSDLDTTDKSSLVVAINEVAQSGGGGGDVTTEQWLYSFPTDTVSGAVASFSDGGDNLPVKDLTIGIEPVQAAETPTPESPLPISGWTGANINANGTTIPITFPTEAGTVFGGTLDVTTGVLTVDRAIIDLSSLTWGTFISSTGTVFSASLPTNITNNPNIRRCTVYKSDVNVVASQAGAIANYTIARRNNNSTIYVKDNRFSYDSSDAAMLKEALVGQTYVYEITPQTYQLTPVEVLTLLGVNTIYADTGDILSLTYRADPTLYADKRSTAARSIIAGIEPTMTASKAYTAGQLLIVGDTLYKVAASIASGAMLTPGTNVNPTTVAEQLLLLANA